VKFICSFIVSGYKVVLIATARIPANLFFFSIRMKFGISSWGGKNNLVNDRLFNLLYCFLKYRLSVERQQDFVWQAAAVEAGLDDCG